MKLTRKLPVRVSLTVFIVVVAVLQGILAKYGLAMETGVLSDLVYLVGAAVLGDTWRPSGSSMAATAAAPQPGPAGGE